MIKLPSCQQRGGDDGSMPIAMLIALVGMSLSALLTTMVTTRIIDTGVAERQVLSLHAAQAGLDVGLAQIRGAIGTNATTGEIEGVKSMLPCDTIAGTVGAGNVSAYSVQPSYYSSDPQGKTDDWLTLNAIKCVQGSGPVTIPAFARFISAGSAASTRGTTVRTLSGTYVLHTTNANIYGGLVRAYKAVSTTPDYCIGAQPLTDTHTDWSAGEQITMQSCSPGATNQTWAYNDVLQFVLIASQRPARPLGLCLDPGGSHAGSPQVLLQACQGTAPSKWRQQWSFGDTALLVGTNLNTGDNTDTSCFVRTQDKTAGSPIYVSTSCSATDDRKWSPDSAVGAGMAGSDAGRKAGLLVNYKQFGRCLDVTSQNPASPYLIAWPCKQNPIPSKVTWNQRWAVPALPSDSDSAQDGTSANHATGTITDTYTTGAVYCLQSPKSALYQQYVTMQTPCSGKDNQSWTVYGHTNQYATSYQIVDGTGLYCLTPRDKDYFSPADLFATTNSVSKIYVAPCDGSTLQKWNADKNVIEALALKDVKEKTK